MLDTGTQIEVISAEGTGTVVYTVQGLAGKGGQGFVFTLQGPGGEPAVLKVPGPRGLLSSEVERRILEKLPPHRNIVRMLGTARVDDIDCAVLRWAHESPFHRLNEPAMNRATHAFRGAGRHVGLPATTAIEMCQEVLAALEHMHRYGYVHGDIKPENILIQLATPVARLPNREYFARLQQRRYRTLLMDFGSTRSSEFLANMGERDAEFAPPEITPIYAPPEVIRGVGDRRGSLTADVYQVGLLLYQWVTGHIPYDHYLEDVIRQSLSAEFLELKRQEAAGQLRPFEPQRILSAPQHDVVFAEKFAAQKLRDRFFENVARVVEWACQPEPDKRPRAGVLRAELIRLFGLQAPPSAEQSIMRVSMWNPSWHLTRVNRLSEASRVKDPVRRPPPPPPTTSGRPLARPAGEPPLPVAVGGAPSPDLRPGAEAPALAREEAEPYEVADAAPEAEGEKGLDGLRLALVDDDKLALAMVSRSLRKRGLKVRTFRDPEEALDVLSRDQPDAAIVDMHMPGMTGLQLIMELERRLNGQPFPILMLSSDEEETTLKEAYLHGASDYLVKPVTEAELVVKLERALQRHRAAVPEGVPRELAGYDLQDEVRRGEFAVLFRAVDTWSQVDRETTRFVKVLRPDVAGEPLPLLRLRREIDVISRCKHPGILTLHHADLWGRLLYYVTDEYPLRSLGEQVRAEGPLDLDSSLRLMGDLASALDHMHRRGMALCDLTPESICMGGDGRFLVTDYGHARWLGAALRADEPAPPVSRYCAPELHADPPRLTPRVDLYALGVVALEAFLGSPAQFRPGGGPIDLLSRVSEPMASTLAQLLPRNPADRLPTAAALLERLGRAENS